MKYNTQIFQEYVHTDEVLNSIIMELLFEWRYIALK